MKRDLFKRPSALVLGVVLVASACAGGTDTESAISGEPLPAAVTPAPALATTAPVATAEPAESVPEPATADPEPTEPAEPAAAVQPVATVSLPAVDVVNLADGSTSSLDGFAQPGATLLWFWAPH